MSSIKNNNMSKIKKSKSAATPASTPTIAPTADEFLQCRDTWKATVFPGVPATPASTPTIAPTADEFPDVPDATWDAAAEIADSVQQVISEAVGIQNAKSAFAQQDFFEGKKITMGAAPYMREAYDAPRTPPRGFGAGLKTPWAPKKTGAQIRSMLCRSVGAGNVCPHGDRCTFAHSDDELGTEVPKRPFITKSVPVSGARIRSMLCRSVGEGNVCPHGDRCTFAHNDDELGTEVPKRPFIPKEDPRYKMAMCFNRVCPHAGCTFAHSEDELRKRMCKYGERCFSVVNRDGRWENKNESGPKCLSYHPDETYENCQSRQQLKVESVKKPIFRATVPADKFLETMGTIDLTKYSEVFITIS